MNRPNAELRTRIPVIRGALEDRAESLLELCRAWTAADQEWRKLSLVWASLEAHLARDHDWFRLPIAERLIHPEAIALRDLEKDMDTASALSEQLLSRINYRSAATPREAIAKLEVATRMLIHEGGPTYVLVADATRRLERSLRR